MVHPCLVVCGKWKCDVDGEWEFVLDKGRMPRNVLVADNVTLIDMCNILVAEFGEPDFMAKEVKISHRLPRFADSSLGRTTPPVDVRTNVCLEKFMQQFADDRTTNLFVTFKDVENSCEPLTLKRNTDVVEEYVPECIIPQPNLMDVQVPGTFRTPQLRKRRTVVEACDPLIMPSGTLKRNTAVVEEYVPECVIPQPNLMDVQGSVTFRTPPLRKRRTVVEACGTQVPIEAPSFDLNQMWVDGSDLDVDGFLIEVEAIEEEIRSSGKKQGEEPCLQDYLEEIRIREKKKGKEICLDDVVEVESDDSVEIADVEELDVRPRGYDKEFWGAFLDEEYGGSNAVEVMCSPSDEFVNIVPGVSGITKDGNMQVGSSGYKGTTSQTGFHSQNSGENGNENPGLSQPRALSDIQDEEFDIPPLFDDTTYEISDIPDLDGEDDDIYVGKTWGTKSDCQTALAIFALKNMFYFKQTRTKKDYFVAECADPKCDWRVTAHRLKDSCYYQIKKACLDHSCSIDTRSQYKKKATAKVIAAVYKAKFNSHEAGPSPKDLQQLLLEDLRISTSYWKCWNVKESGNLELRGTDEQSFVKLAEYLYVLKLANPGTIADIETITDIESGCERFLYLFLSFGASIRGFRYLRNVIVLDGTHLTGKYKGVLLTASGQDANFQVFPVAFAVVDIEDDDSWTWFLTKLKQFISDSPSLTLISDRHQSIYNAKKAAFPQAHHGACVVHLARNVTGRFKSKGLGKVLVRAACSYQVRYFRDSFREIESRSSACAKFLRELGFAHWTRAYFEGNRYNMMTSNIAESLNNALKKGKDSPITELIMFIQAMLTRWFSARRQKSQMHRGLVTPEVDKLITKHLAFAKGSRVSMISKWSYEVTGQFGCTYNVHLNDRRCSCKKYDVLQIPCSHALLAADMCGVSYGRLAGECFRSSVWEQTYAGIIQRHEDPRDIEIPEDVRGRVLLPPRTKRPAGRPRLKRLTSFGDFHGTKAIHKCGRCKASGHNRTSCTNPI